MKLKITYNKQHVDKPVLSNVVLRTGVPINILDAKVSPGGGEVIVDVLAPPSKVKEVVDAFISEGVGVKEITKAIEADASRCIACGACVSPCPVGAISLREGMVEVDEAKCVRCQACVNACPMKAIRVL
ncbi:MAG: [Fe-S]-binding protein [Thermoprotei archaeon]|nr:MAG: [Fe-S]-binding protein [Thermoprotei archaeon]